MIDLGSLKDRFFGEKPPTDPHRERDRVDRDSYKNVFARAEAFATMGPPVDATLDPVTAPDNVQMRANAPPGGPRSARRPETSELQAANLRPPQIGRGGVSRGLEAGRDALVQEAGWSFADAERLKRQAERGEMTEAQFMRTVESELQRSETSGRMVDPPTQRGPEGVDRRRSSGRFVSDDREPSGVGRGDGGQFERVEQLVRGER